MGNEYYISIDRVEIITGLSKKKQLNFSITTKNSIFFYYNADKWIEVPLSVITRMYNQSGEDLPKNVKINFLINLNINDFYVRDSDIRKFMVFPVLTDNDDSIPYQKLGIILPDTHEYLPKGLKIAMECWTDLYEHAEPLPFSRQHALIPNARQLGTLLP